MVARSPLSRSGVTQRATARSIRIRGLARSEPPEPRVNGGSYGSEGRDRFGGQELADGSSNCACR